MTPIGRAALLIGVVLMVGGILAATATVHAGQSDCGTALSAHAPVGRFLGSGTESVAEDRCDRKITGRRRLVAAVGTVGLLIAILGALDHERSP